MRSVVLWGVLAGASLGAAWAVARAPSHAAGERPIVLALRPVELRQIRFVHGAMELALERCSDPTGAPCVWITLSAAGRSPLSFRGNRSAERLLERMAPLRAQRALGVLSAAELREAGLADTRDAILVQATTGAHRLRVAPPAAHDQRIVTADDGSAYAIDAELVPVLELAPRELFETRLHGFRAAEVDDITLEPGGRHAPKNAQLMALQKALAPSELAWTAPEVTVSYFDHGRKLGFVEISRRGSSCIGRSERSIGPVVLPAEACPIAP